MRAGRIFYFYRYFNDLNIGTRPATCLAVPDSNDPKEADMTAIALAHTATLTDREADLLLPTHAGPEIGVASTKAFTTQITVLTLLALKLAQEKGIFQEQRFREILAEIERAYIEKAMECTDGNKNKAADLLGLSLRSFRYRVDKLNPN